MRIRKLEVHGFKSFPDRTALHFGPGISGIVGSNGCGKSNVIDAVKWCLGEQSAKSLRGKSMGDVIFAGAQDRSPSGSAEVSISFVAGDEPFPGEFARFEEVMITRRMFRDGGSEYRINQERARLRDIQDLFLDTGVTNRMYSFIEIRPSPYISESDCRYSFIMSVCSSKFPPAGSSCRSRLRRLLGALGGCRGALSRNER